MAAPGMVRKVEGQLGGRFDAGFDFCWVFWTVSRIYMDMALCNV